MRVAAVQMTAGADRDRNLAAAGSFVHAAATDGAELVVLPELFALLGRGGEMRAGAEPLDGPTSQWASDLARRFGIWLLAGSFPERAVTAPSPAGAADGEGDLARYHNTSCLWSPSGDRVATYRKIHLFDNEVPGAAYRESASVVPGDEVVVAPISRRRGHPQAGAADDRSTGDDAASDDAVPVGLSVCYDLRFPELFQALAAAGARLIVLPSAFTAVTGEAHWEVLVRARAIETQCFVVAADQVGLTGAGIACHGHTMVVDPWGRVLGELDGTTPGVLLVDLDLDEVDEVRRRLPSLGHRRPELYGPTASAPPGVD